MAATPRSAYGLSDVVYSVYDVAAGTYGAVKTLPGAVALSFDSASTITTLYADDGQYDAADAVGDMGLSLENVDVTPDKLAELTGMTYSAGQLIQSPTDLSPHLAIGGKIRLSGKDGSSNVFKYVWYYNVVLNKPSSEDKTKATSVEFRTMKFEGRVLKNLTTNCYRMAVRTDDTNVAALTLSGFFTTVFTPGGSNTAVTVGTASGSDSANTITIPFAKSGETFSMLAPAQYDITITVVSTGLLIAGSATQTYALSAAGVAPTIIVSNANITNVAYIVTVTNHVTDVNNVKVTPLSQIVTPT
jgi:phi13 family phage major tail protein